MSAAAPEAPAVKVRPAIEMVWPGASALKLTAADSVVRAPPSVVVIVGAIAGAEGVALKLVTLELGVPLVNVMVLPLALPVLQPADVPVVKDPPLKLPKIFVAVKLLMVCV